MVYNPRERYLSAYNPRLRYLSGHGKSHAYLKGLGCECTRMVGPLGQDIAPPDISAGAPSGGYTVPGASVAPPPPPIPAQSTMAPLAPPTVAAPGTFPAISAGAPTPAMMAYSVPGGVMATGPGVSAQAAPGTIFGMPSQYLIYGGLAVLAAAVLGSRK